MRGLAALTCLTFLVPLAAQDKPHSALLLGRDVIGPKQTLEDLQAHVDARIPRIPKVHSGKEWLEQAEMLRQRVLDEVVFRGEARRWRNHKAQVEWLDAGPAGVGYSIQKLRYEALPGLWIPALLYVPDQIQGKVPVMLAVNGHDGAGKAAPYKQIRCINLAKRGMLVLNVEWLGMGQLRTPGFRHYAMNQLDLCGTSGLAPFYLAMARALDVLLAHAHADVDRVAVSGLSGGGWQTIVISSLDTRVKLSNPVAGYSSFRTRLRHFKDLGDSEQTPTDLARFADYAHLTAMLAPRPLLLTYNSKDNCCFESGYALPPLLEAARPIYRLLDVEKKLRSHVNDDPGTHNFEKDNRQALYRMIGDQFYPGDKNFNADEIPCADEVRKPADLHVALPDRNADFNTLAKSLAETLPRNAALPTEPAAARRWQTDRRGELRDVVKFSELRISASKAGAASQGDVSAVFWRLRLDDAWTVPVVELTRGKPKGTTLLVGDAGRAALAGDAERLLASGQRVLAVDPFFFGESKFPSHQVLWALMLATVGDRALGLQAGEIAAAARWAGQEYGVKPDLFVAGPRLGVAALAAVALSPHAAASLTIREPLGSLKELIEQNRTVDQMPELFCFGLLQTGDVRQLIAMAAPVPVHLLKPSDRARSELGGLADWFSLLGAKCDPLADVK